MTDNRSFTFGHKPIFKSPHGSAPEVIYLGDSSQQENAKFHAQSNGGQTTRNWSLKHRVAALLAVIAVPAMAAPSDFGALPGGAPTEAETVRERLQEELARNPAMPFERPGMSFPGSAFFFLADPPSDALIALPTTDALSQEIGEAGREVGALIDAGPSARPFFGTGGNNLARAQDCLAQAVWYEAASEREAGQRAVAQVVLNRVKHPSWPSSVCGVVYQGSSRRTGCQFTFTCDGSLRRKPSGSSWARAQNIATDALSGSVYEPIGHATHYHTLWINPYWASSLDHVGTIGAHRFYRNRGSGGRKEAFTQNYTGTEPGAQSRVTPAPSFELADLANGEEASRDHVGDTGVSTSNSGQSRNARSQASQTSTTGLGAPLIQPSVSGAGQVRDDYARAGQWKSDAARAALQDDRQSVAEGTSAQSADEDAVPR
ncbi:MAG: cell wall hydrolase [Erythrobacter sp.]|uniref:cell wall hydrolase n=1 Tax=Erythrobacter sp. TaxID=1042 RepID=UPI003267249D